MKINGNEIRPGHIIRHQDALWATVKTGAVKPGKGGAFNQVELKNIKDGRKLNTRFRSAETVERVRLEQKDFTYLYAEGNMYIFMDATTYEQISLEGGFIGDKSVYLTDGMAVQLEFHEETALNIRLPEHVTVEILDTEAVVKGQTVSGSYKPATVTGGIRTNVPQFIGTEERIIISTEDGTYVKRAEG